MTSDVIHHGESLFWSGVTLVQRWLNNESESLQCHADVASTTRNTRGISNEHLESGGVGCRRNRGLSSIGNSGSHVDTGVIGRRRRASAVAIDIAQDEKSDEDGDDGNNDAQRGVEVLACTISTSLWARLTTHDNLRRFWRVFPTLLRNVEPSVGFEPTTYRLQGGCSATELTRRNR